MEKMYEGSRPWNNNPILLLQNQDILSPPEQHWVSIKLSLKTLEDSPALIHQD